MRRYLRAVFFGFLLLLILALVVLLAFRSKYRTAIRELAQTQVKNSTSDLINDAIDKQIELGNIQYDRIVYFEKDLNGRITALKTNMSEVNRLKTDILNIINDDILALEDLPKVPGGSARAASLNFVPLHRWEELSVKRAEGKGGAK